MAPMAAPMISTISAATMPMISETRVPYMHRDMMSRPEESVPKKWGKTEVMSSSSAADSESGADSGAESHPSNR